MRALQLTFIRTGTFDDLMIRPYVTEVDARSIAHLQESTANGTMITPATVAGASGSILNQMTHPEGIVTINNGWSEPRLRFMLELETDYTAITRNRQIFTGYTDYIGYSKLGQDAKIDPNMRLYFNSTQSLRDQKYANGQITSTVADNSQLIFGGNLANTAGQLISKERTYGLRPQDLFGNQAATAMANGYGGGSMCDTRTTMVQGVRKSSRQNAIPARYLSRNLTALSQAQTNTDLENNPIQQVYQDAFGAVQEQHIQSDRTLSIFANRTQYLQQGYITYGELCAIVDGIDGIANIFEPKGIQQQQELSVRGSVQNWQGTGTETLYATRLTSSVPSLMVENMMTSVFFNATNQTATGEFVVRFEKDSVKSFTQGLDMTPYLSRFEQSLILEVLVSLTSNGLIDINITGNVNIMGESTWWISIHGQPAVPFVAPTFCDSLYSPVMTINQTSVAQLGYDIDRLTNFIGVAPINQY